MRRQSIFKEGKRYTFSDYFEMRHPVEEIVAALGYSLSLEPLTLPTRRDISQEVITKLQESYYELLPKITLNSEAAKREVMIAPVLHEAIRHIEAKLNIEYPIDVDDRLSGTVDYLIRAKHELIVIEAKKGDLDKGFNQLAAELIALDKYEAEDPSNIFYGAITIGEVWRFALIKRREKKVVRDVHTYRFPEDVKDILGSIEGILLNVH